MNPWLLSIAVSYLLGSIPFGYLLVRLFRNQDVRATGSGNIGATNVARSGGKALGIATLLLDLAKGTAAVLLAFLIAKHFGLFADQPIEEARAAAFDFAMIAAISAILGHVYPVWLLFRGGKGVATALGVFLALSPRTAGSILLLFLVVLAITRFVSLASIIAAASVPLFARLYLHSLSHIALFGFLFIPFLVIAKHHGNIRRLIAGTESRFGRSSSTPTAKASV